MGIQNSKKHYSSKQEKTIANALGWKVVSGSGSRSGHPGDVVSEEWLGECKTHVSPGHKIQFYQSVWNKLSDEAFAMHKFPVLFVDDGSQNLKNTWCLFTAEPPENHLFILFEGSIGTSISFKNEEMLKNHSKKTNGSPLIYVVQLNEFESLYLSTFYDFKIMFEM